MSDLPRYEELFDHDLLPHPDGPWVKWGDVSAHLQQLEAEKATLARRLASAEQGCRLTEVEMPNGAVCLAPCVIEGCQYDELETSRTALAETRDALQQLEVQHRRLRDWFKTAAETMADLELRPAMFEFLDADVENLQAAPVKDQAP